MALENPRFSIVTPVQDDDNIASLCDSLPQTKGFTETEMLIIRNGTPSSSVREITDKFAESNPNVRIIDTSQVGSTVARNRGIQDARGEHIVFLDSDVTVNSNFFLKVGEIVDQFPNADVVQTKLFRLEKSENDRPKKWKFGEKLERRMKRLISAHYTLLSRMDKPPVNNPGLIIKKTLLDAIGSLDQNFSRGNDYDLSKRIRGKKTVYARNAVVFHAADSPVKFFRQSFNYGRDRSPISKKQDKENRLGIIKDRLRAVVFVPYFLKELSKGVGVEMAAFEGAKSMVSAAGFWYQEAKTFIDNLTSQRKRSSV